MAGSPCRVRVAVTADDTDCITLTGDGTPTSPLTADPVIPAGAVVPHPLAPGVLPDTINGPVCTPTGLMAPQPGFPAFASASAPFGSNPDIIANTGGAIPWGPIITATMTNPNTDRFLQWHEVDQNPLIAMVLEPGATARVGFILDPLGLAIYFETWGMTNLSGASVETYTGYSQTFVSSSFFEVAGGTVTRDGQMWVELTGATGSSSVTTFGQSGMNVKLEGVPV